MDQFDRLAKKMEEILSESVNQYNDEVHAAQEKFETMVRMGREELLRVGEEAQKLFDESRTILMNAMRQPEAPKGFTVEDKGD